MFSENIGCWCGNKTTTKTHVKPTCFLKLCRTIFEETCLPQKIIQTKSLPNTISREISTKKTRFFSHQKWQKLKPMKANENTFSSDCINSDFFWVASHGFFQIFGLRCCVSFWPIFFSEILWLKLLFSCFAIKKSLERLFDMEMFLPFFGRECLFRIFR